MNREQRGIDRPTDVLSFPMIEYETAGEFDFLENQPECFHPESGEALLGDIVISKEKVISQAEEYGHSPSGVCLLICPQYAASHGLRPHDAGRSGRYGKEAGRNTGKPGNYPVRK